MYYSLLSFFWLKSEKKGDIVILEEVYETNVGMKKIVKSIEILSFKWNNGTQCVLLPYLNRSKIEKWASWEHSERYLEQLCEKNRKRVQ